MGKEFAEHTDMHLGITQQREDVEYNLVLLFGGVLSCTG